jgi:hypothetical protein
VGRRDNFGKMINLHWKVDKRSTYTGGRGKKINLHWLVERRDNFRKRNNLH